MTDCQTWFGFRHFPRDSHRGQITIHSDHPTLHAKSGEQVGRMTTAAKGGIYINSLPDIVGDTCIVDTCVEKAPASDVIVCDILQPASGQNRNRLPTQNRLVFGTQTDNPVNSSPFASKSAESSDNHVFMRLCHSSSLQISILLPWPTSTSFLSSSL